MSLSDDEIRDRLVVAMTVSTRGNTYAQWADTILPTVRAIAADEREKALERVRALADDLDVDSCDPMPDDRSRLLFDTAQRIRAALA